MRDEVARVNGSKAIFNVPCRTSTFIIVLCSFFPLTLWNPLQQQLNKVKWRYWNVSISLQLFGNLSRKRSREIKEFDIYKITLIFRHKIESLYKIQNSPNHQFYLFFWFSPSFSIFVWFFFYSGFKGHLDQTLVWFTAQSIKPPDPVWFLVPW